VSADIAKGGRSRSVAVIADLEPIVAEIRMNVPRGEYVLPAQRFRDPPFNTSAKTRRRPSSSQALRQLVMRVAERAGIGAHVYPHLLRHAFAAQIARQVDTRTASAAPRARKSGHDRHVPGAAEP